MTIWEFRRRLKALHSQGWVWRRIGALFGHTKGWAHKIANYPIPVSDEVLQKAEQVLPPLPWQNRKELDDLVVDLLGEHGRLTGRELGRLCGTGDRTIRSSIKRLREAGKKVDASLAPPRGYRLEEEP